MGIAFVDNDGECGGVYVDEVLDSVGGGVAAPLQKGDQLVGAAGGVAKGKDVDAVLGMPAGREDEARLSPRADDLSLYGPTHGRRVVRLRGARLNLVRIFQSRARPPTVQDQAEALGDREETVIGLLGRSSQRVEI